MADGHDVENVSLSNIVSNPIIPTPTCIQLHEDRRSLDDDVTAPVVNGVEVELRVRLQLGEPGERWSRVIQDG